MKAVASYKRQEKTEADSNFGDLPAKQVITGKFGFIMGHNGHNL